MSTIPSSRPDGARRRILVLVRDRSVRRAFDRLLKKDGFRADLPASFEDAPSLLEPGRYDAIFVDEDGGASGGLEFVREARKRGVDGAIVLLAARNGESLARQVAEAGATGILLKPVSAEDVRSCLQRIVLQDGLDLVGAAAHSAGRRSKDSARSFFYLAMLACALLAVGLLATILMLA